MGALFQETLLNQAVTASVTGASFDVPDVTMLAVCVDMSAGAATITDCDVYLEGSCDGGTTWHSLVCDLGGTDGGTAFTTPAINIVDGKTTTTSESVGGIYKHLGVSKIRPRVTFTGSGGGTLTIKITASGK